MTMKQETRDERRAHLEAERQRLNGAFATVAMSLPVHLDTGKASPAYQQRTEIGLEIDAVEVELARTAVEEATERRDAYLTEFDPVADDAAVEAARVAREEADAAAFRARKAEAVARARRSDHRAELRHRERAVVDAQAGLSRWLSEQRRDELALAGVRPRLSAAGF